MDTIDNLIHQVLLLRTDVKKELLAKANNLDIKLAKLVESSLRSSTFIDCRRLYHVENEELKALWSLYMELCDQLLLLLNTKRGK